MSSSAFVYWVHLPEHIDVTQEGYVGITTQTVEKRFSQHMKDSTKGDYVFHRAIKKHKESLAVDTLLVGSHEYCLLIEKKLRPDNFVGWNMAIGGGGCVGVREVSDEARSNMSAAQTKLWADEKYISKMKAAKMESKHYESAVALLTEHRVARWADESKRKDHSELMKKKSVELGLGKELLNYSKNTRPWNRAFAAQGAWMQAEEAFELFKSIAPTAYKLSKSLSISVKSARNLIKHFNNNWLPAEDAEWVTWQTNNLNVKEIK